MAVVTKSMTDVSVVTQCSFMSRCSDFGMRVASCTHTTSSRLAMTALRPHPRHNNARLPLSPAQSPTNDADGRQPSPVRGSTPQGDPDGTRERCAREAPRLSSPRPTTRSSHSSTRCPRTQWRCRARVAPTDELAEHSPGLLTSPLVAAAGVALWSRLQRLTTGELCALPASWSRRRACPFGVSSWFTSWEELTGESPFKLHSPHLQDARLPIFRPILVCRSREHGGHG
jgi:hypothetical protein